MPVLLRPRTAPPTAPRQGGQSTGAAATCPTGADKDASLPSVSFAWAPPSDVGQAEFLIRKAALPSGKGLVVESAVLRLVPSAATLMRTFEALFLREASGFVTRALQWQPLSKLVVHDSDTEKSLTIGVPNPHAEPSAAPPGPTVSAVTCIYQTTETKKPSPRDNSLQFELVRAAAAPAIRAGLRKEKELLGLLVACIGAPPLPSCCGVTTSRTGHFLEGSPPPFPVLFQPRAREACFGMAVTSAPPEAKAPRRPGNYDPAAGSGRGWGGKGHRQSHQTSITAVPCGTFRPQPRGVRKQPKVSGGSVSAN
ncbi:hypothetical protein CB1_000709021 [Camelus ferus]|nr:hypothetical protein CB1_000709021 [Camelus ferus]